MIIEPKQKNRLFYLIEEYDLIITEVDLVKNKIKLLQTFKNWVEQDFSQRTR